MRRMIIRQIAVAILIVSMVAPVWGAVVEVNVTVETITGHRKRFDLPLVDAEQSYILIDVSDVDTNGDGIKDVKAVATLLMFPGGPGKLGVQDEQLSIRPADLLVRARHHFAAERFNVAVMDAASDFLARPEGLQGHRMKGRPLSAQYLKDIKAVINDLRSRFPDLPLWGIGISRGTISAGRAGAELDPIVDSPPDGLVLAAPLTGPSNIGDLQGVDLESITVPTLVVTNRDDQCPRTRPEDPAALKKRLVSSPRVQVLFFKGGSTPLQDSCVPFPFTHFLA